MLSVLGYGKENKNNQHNNMPWYYARITFYTNDSRYGKKTASGNVAVEGTTVATDRGTKFGTKLSIPELRNVVGNDDIFVVQDRGSAVQKRTASNGKLPVIDVYVSSNKKVKSLSATKKYHMVKVYPIK